MNILAFAASSSSSSINYQLLRYATGLLESDHVELLDINDYEMPLFSEDREAELGHPQLAYDFLGKINESDAVVISFAEHNGSYTAAYKNLFDWASRINPKVFQNKPMVFLATSPGPGGASTVLGTATTSAPYFDGIVKATLSVPSFYANFDSRKGRLKDEELIKELMITMNSLRNQETGVQ